MIRKTWVVWAALLAILAGPPAPADDKTDDQGPTDDMQKTDDMGPVDAEQPKEGPSEPSEPYGEDQLQLRQQAIQDMTQAPNSPSTALTVYQLGETYRNHNDFANAMFWYNKALSILGEDPNIQSQDLGISIDYRLPNQPSFGMPNSGLTARVYSSLGSLYLSVGEYQYAERYYTSALAFWLGAEGGFDSSTDALMLNTAHAMNNLADAYTAQGRFYDSEILYRRALLMEESTYGKNSQYLVPELKRLANLFMKQGRRSEAAQFQARIKSICGDSPS